jgi:ubiquinone/menaquinone biosynthesis C-methylase UbiE
MEPDRLYHDPDFAQFYDLENGWSDDLEYCQHLATGCRSILDLGCGTGLFATALASEPDRKVVGIDPAKPMLDIARQRPGAERVRWLQADARNIRINQRFDLIVMTGHVFQVFLSPEDQLAVLRTIAAHLTPEGCFIFDSRNPAVAPWQNWTPEKSRHQIQHPNLGPILAWHDMSHDPTATTITYETHYRILSDDQALCCRSKLTFPNKTHLTALLQTATLHPASWLGDWSGTPFTSTSPEIIPIGHLR